jgi:hypothetical protein
MTGGPRRAENARIQALKMIARTTYEDDKEAEFVLALNALTLAVIRLGDELEIDRANRDR